MLSPTSASFNFTLSAHDAALVARLCAACDPKHVALSGVFVEWSPGKPLSFTATDGRLLASAVCCVADVNATEPLSFILSGRLLAQARKGKGPAIFAYTPVPPGFGSQTVQVRRTLIPVIDVAYPSWRNVLPDPATKPAWIPHLGWKDAFLAEKARTIAGHDRALYWSCAVSEGDAACFAPCVDSMAPAGDGSVAQAVRDSLRQPAVWASSQLLLLLMPISVGNAGPMDLAPFRA